jgi:hypothetical protein
MIIAPAREYISPYSARRYQQVAWQDVSPGWSGIYRAVAWADSPVLEYVQMLKFATRSQLLRHFYNSNVNGRKRIERMVRTGLLVRHSLIGKASETALYTLGPLGSELLQERWVPNWWRPVTLVEVLKRLVTGELYLGVAGVWPCVYAGADWPLTAWFTFGGMEYGVLVLRDDVEAIRRKISKSTAMRLIVIVERIGDAARLNSALEVPARFILDRELILKQFSQCVMYRFEDGLLVSESLSEDRGADPR